ARRGRGDAGEEVAGIQDAISQKLQTRTMKAIGPALRNDNRLASDNHSVFSAEGCGHHAQFANSFNSEAGVIHRPGWRVALKVLHRRPVQQIGVGSSSRSIGTQPYPTHDWPA